MHVISVEKAKDGMTIVRDVVSPSGQLLAQKGSIISKSLQKGLIEHGIIDIAVLFENEEEATFSEKKMLEAENTCREKVLQRFREKPSDPMMKLIFKIALKIEAMEYLEKSNGG